MANGYKLVDDPLEGILGNVLRLQQLQEGYDRAEQQKQDRYFNKLSSFQQNLSSNMSSSSAMEIARKAAKSFYDANKYNMDSTLDAAYIDFLELADNQIKEHGNAQLSYNELLNFTEDFFGYEDADNDPSTPDTRKGLFKDIENLNSRQEWSVKDSDGLTFADKTIRKLGAFEKIKQKMLGQSQYLTPSQQQAINQSLPRLDNIVSTITGELEAKQYLAPEQINDLYESPDLFIQRADSSTNLRKKQEEELIISNQNSQLAINLFNEALAKLEKNKQEGKGEEPVIWNNPLATEEDVSSFDLSDDEEFNQARALVYSINVSQQAQEQSFMNAYPGMGLPYSLQDLPAVDPAKRQDKDSEKDKDLEQDKQATPEIEWIEEARKPESFKESRDRVVASNLGAISSFLYDVVLTPATERMAKRKPDKVKAGIAQNEAIKQIKESSKNLPRIQYVKNAFPKELKITQKDAYILNRTFLELTAIAYNRGIKPSEATDEFISENLNNLLEEGSIFKDINLINLYKGYTKEFDGELKSPKKKLKNPFMGLRGGFE